MKLVFIFVIFSDALLLIHGQSSLDDHFSPFVRLTRLIMSNLVKPRSFEAGYRQSAKIDVSEACEH